MTVTSSTIRNNAGGAGGGIYNRGSSIITNSTVSGNNSSAGGLAIIGGGGGIYNEGSLSVTNSTVSGNAVGAVGCGDTRAGPPDCYPGWGGGGINNLGTLILNYSTISHNTAGNGGCNPFTIGHCDTGSGGKGGGINNRGTVTVFNSTISGNAPGNAGCRQSRENAPITCGLSGEGGGIYNANTLTLDSSTIAKNIRGKSTTVDDPLDGPDPVQTLQYGTVGGIYNAGATVRIKNNIIANNENSDCGGSFTSEGYNLVRNVISCTVSSNVYWAAYLDPLDDNGGPTLTHALNDNSQAIDAGDCTDSTGAPVTLDQRGQPRPQGDGCDIGAYESPFTSTFTISTTNLPMIEQ